MLTIFKCKKCGKLAIFMGEVEGPVTCGGEEMRRMKAGEVDAAAEKHVPVVSVEGDTVKVDIGAVAHPMAEEHSILWVYMQTDRGGQRKALSVGSEPVVYFALKDEKPVAVYAYCNLHGLWKTDI